MDKDWGILLIGDFWPFKLVGIEKRDFSQIGLVWVMTTGYIVGLGSIFGEGQLR